MPRRQSYWQRKRPERVVKIIGQVYDLALIYDKTGIGREEAIRRIVEAVSTKKKKPTVTITPKTPRQVVPVDQLAEVFGTEVVLQGVTVDMNYTPIVNHEHEVKRILGIRGRIVQDGDIFRVGVDGATNFVTIGSGNSLAEAIDDARKSLTE